MALNLLESVRGLFTNDVVNRTASALGESEGAVQKTIGAVVPTILTGVLHKASTDGGSSILNLARDAAGTGILGNIGSFLGGGGGSFSNLMGMAGSLFGDKLGNVARLISGFAGVKESSANSLLILTAPVALGVLGKHAADNNLNASGLLSFLNSQKSTILNAIPSGLNLAGALGLGSLSDIGTKLSNMVSGATGTVREFAGTTRQAVETPERAGNRWLWPLLLGLLVVALGIYLFRSCGGQRTEAVTDTVSAAIDTPAAPITTAVTRESIKVRLPDGTELDAYRGGIEDKLVACLNDATCSAGTDAWFDFDDLNFAVKTAGAPAAQLAKPEGYGSQFAKEPADAAYEVRAKDRRISVQLREKGK
jgi:hypothetical protein